jgi:uncharacterized protein YciI
VWLLVAASLALAGPGRKSATLDEPRSESSLVVFEEVDGKNRPVAIVTVHHGAPTWREELEKELHLLQGMVWRLGKNGWTVLDSSVPFALGSQRLAAGIYYLGLTREESGRWVLELVDPAEARAKQAFPMTLDKVLRRRPVFLTEEKLEAAAERLEVRLVRDEANVARATLVVRWGTRRLSAPVELMLDEKPAAKAGAPAFVVFFRPGPKWRKDAGLTGQPGMEDHKRYMGQLMTSGTMSQGGPVMETSGDVWGGIAVLRCASEEEARKVAEADPGVKAGLLQMELRRWFVQ